MRQYRNGSDSGSGEWLQPLILRNLHEVLSTLGAVKAAQEQMPRDLMRHMDRQSDHFSERLADLSMNHGLRLSALEDQMHQRSPSPSDQPSLAVKLFGSVGAWAIERVPWKHVAYMAPGLVVAVAGHLFPTETAVALKAWFPAWRQ